MMLYNIMSGHRNICYITNIVNRWIAYIHNAPCGTRTAVLFGNMSYNCGAGGYSWQRSYSLDVIYSYTVFLYSSKIILKLLNWCSGEKNTVFNSKSSIQIGGWLDASAPTMNSPTLRQSVMDPFIGIMSGFTFNGIRVFTEAENGVYTSGMSFSNSSITWKCYRQSQY